MSTCHRLFARFPKLVFAYLCLWLVWPACDGGINESVSRRGSLEFTRDDIDQRLSAIRTFRTDRPAHLAVQELTEHGDERLVRETLIQEASESDAIGSLSANYVLFKLGDRPRDRVRAFSEVLRKGTHDDKLLAADLLQSLLFPESDDTFVQDFLPLLTDPDPLVREAILRMICSFPDTPGVREALVSGALDENPAVRIAAATGLSCNAQSTEDYATDEVLSILLKLLSDEVEYVRADACFLLRPFADRATVVAALQNVLEHDVPSVRASALEVLATILPPDKGLHLVIDSLDSDVLTVKLRAINQLAGFEDTKRTVPVLIRILEQNDPISVETAYKSLEYLGPRAAPATSTLTDIAERGVAVQSAGPSFGPADRFYPAIRVLGAIGPAAQEAVPFLGSLLDDDDCLQDAMCADYYIKLESVTALGRIKGQATRYAPRVLEIASSSMGELQYASIDAIGELAVADESLIQGLSKLLAGSDQTEVAVHVRLSLFKLGYQPQKQVDGLISALEGDNKATVRSAAEALAAIGKPAIKALPRLREIAETYWCSDVIYAWVNDLEEVGDPRLKGPADCN